MNNNTPRQEQILEAAMCAWEEIDYQTTSKLANKPRIWTLMTDLRAALGTPTMRYYTGEIAESISRAFEIAETEAGGYFDGPFDFWFVPEFLGRTLEVTAGCGKFGLADDWMAQAEAMGRKQRIASAARTKPSEKSTDREVYLLGLVRCLVMGLKFSECVDVTTMRAIINDAVSDADPNDLDCEEFRELAPEAFNTKTSGRVGYELDERELATILASLRQRQIGLDRSSPSSAAFDALEDIATSAGDFDALSSADIDALCERINCST